MLALHLPSSAVSSRPPVPPGFPKDPLVPILIRQFGSYQPSYKQANSTAPSLQANVTTTTTMTMFSAKSLVVLAAVAASASAVSAQSFTYEFDPVSAAGVKGHVRVDYASDSATTADVSANLDFSGIDLAAIQQADGNCTGEPTEYKWHIHAKWSSAKSSDAFAMCSKAATSNHYDPLYACGPNSEFAETPQCLPKIASYACSPANYTLNPLVCEKGDLSGKFGGFKLDANKKVSGKWTDVHYPTVGENTPQWNIILHAVCGKNTPRIACAVAKRAGGGGDNGGKPVTPAPSTVKPAAPVPATTTVKPATAAPTKGQC